MSMIEFVILIESQRQQRRYIETELFGEPIPKQIHVKQKKFARTLSQWFGSTLVYAGEKILQYAN